MKSRTFRKLFEKEDNSYDGIMARTFGDGIPDGEKELEWDLEHCKQFMQQYLEMDRDGTLPMQNRKRWNYELWLYLMEKYAEGLPLMQIGKVAKEHFDAVKVSNNPHKFVAAIINHRGWRIAQRMRVLLRQELMNSVEEGKASSALRAQQAELEHLGKLEEQLAKNTKLLASYDPEEAEYASVLRNIKDLEKLISKFSGSEMFKHLQMYRAKEDIKAASNKNTGSTDPKLITPKLIE